MTRSSVEKQSNFNQQILLLQGAKSPQTIEMHVRYNIINLSDLKFYHAIAGNHDHQRKGTTAPSIVICNKGSCLCKLIGFRETFQERNLTKMSKDLFTTTQQKQQEQKRNGLSGGNQFTNFFHMDLKKNHHLKPTKLISLVAYGNEVKDSKLIGETKQKK